MPGMETIYLYLSSFILQLKAFVPQLFFEVFSLFDPVFLLVPLIKLGLVRQYVVNTSDTIAEVHVIFNTRILEKEKVEICMHNKNMS